VLCCGREYFPDVVTEINDVPNEANHAWGLSQANKNGGMDEKGCDNVGKTEEEDVTAGMIDCCLL
jgi:hypothetical protein